MDTLRNMGTDYYEYLETCKSKLKQGEIRWIIKSY